MPYTFFVTDVQGTNSKGEKIVNQMQIYRKIDKSKNYRGRLGAKDQARQERATQA